MTRLRFVAALAVGALGAVSAPGCSSQDAAAPTENPMVAGTNTTSVTLPAEIRVFVAPGTTEGFQGARDDVTSHDCAPTEIGWVTYGTLANPTGSPANYRVYTTFNSPSGQLRALLQTDVNDVAAGDRADWLNQVEITDDAVTCVLRVERVTTG